MFKNSGNLCRVKPVFDICEICRQQYLGQFDTSTQSWVTWRDLQSWCCYCVKQNDAESVDTCERSREVSETEDEEDDDSNYGEQDED